MEHGMLDRIMLAIDHTLQKAEGASKPNVTPVLKACGMIKQVVDEHHMKLEEKEIYPKFRDDRILGKLSRDLEDQHNEARKMTARMKELSSGSNPDVRELRRVFQDFRTMMVAHAAREQTVLFPAMVGTWTDEQLDALKEAQEADEKRLLGEDADEKVYKMMGDIETAAGIRSVSDFTRRLR